MLQTYSLFETEEEISPASVESNQNFTVEEVLWTTISEKNNDLYKQIVYKVLRNSTHLISHIQRIYFTYNRGLSDPLYAALVDLLLALDGNGKQLSARMITITHSLLSEQQYQSLADYLTTQDATVLSANNYTILTKGLVTPSFLLVKET